VWSDTVNENDGINNIGIYNSDDVVVTFNFPYNLDNIEVQSMEVEVEAYGVNFGNDYNETIWIYNSSGEKEYLGDMPYGVYYKEFIIDNPVHYAYDYYGTKEIKLELGWHKPKNITTIFYNKNGSVESISKSLHTDIFWFEFPWPPENTDKVKIIIRKKCGGDCVFVDGDYVGILNEGGGITSFTIDKENATNYLSDGSITIKVEKSKDGTPDRINVTRITVRVFYTNVGEGATTKTPIPLGVIVITLITTPIIALKRLSS
jgi:hypothetical protein